MKIFDTLAKPINWKSKPVKIILFSLLGLIILFFLGCIHNYRAGSF